MQEQQREKIEVEFQKEYENAQEYFVELSAWGKSWIHFYSEFTAESFENGEISGMKGKLLFQKELQKLCQPDFTEEEVEKYHAGSASRFFAHRPPRRPHTVPPSR